VTGDAGTRRRITERLDASMLVEAGAGTGKTRALVERVVALVGSRTPIERIAAITFTERAAAELRDRVREELEVTALRPDGDVAERCRVALAALDRAQLSTIHSFGQALLRAFAAEAGVDPEMVVLDDLTAERRREERWRVALEGLDLDSGDGRAIDRAVGLGMAPGDLRALAGHMADREDIARAFLAAPPAAPAPRWDEVPRLRDVVSAVEVSRVAGDDPLLAHLEELDALLGDIAARTGAERDALLSGGASVWRRKCGRLGTQGAWGGRDRIAAARDAAAGVCAGMDAVLRDARAQALAGVLPVLARFSVDDGDARRRAGTLVFADLILWTRDLLVGQASARAALRARYDALLIDEFQDTDSWQMAIAEAFAGEPKTGALEPGRLFLVGDPKQSIYRFRQADMAVYRAARERVEADGGLLEELSENRRSRAPVVTWVNAVFPRLMGDGDDPGIQPPYRPIVAERDDDLAGPGVTCIGGPADAPAGAVREDEAAEVARACRAVVAEGWGVRGRDGSARRARLGDVAVLIPTRTGLPELERALAAAGVPFRVEGGTLVYRTQELRDLLNCLTAIDDPWDEVAVVGALRSPAFGCSDVELAEHRRAGGSWSMLAPGLDVASGRVADSLRELRALHLRRHDSSLAALVERVVAARRIVEIGLLDGAGRDAYRRARFVIEQARAFEADRPRGLRPFVAWLEERASGPVRDLEGVGLDDDEDAIRVLTIHAAKGLEFPIVVLAGLGTAPRPAEAPKLALDPPVAWVGARSRNARFELGDVATARQREQLHADAEGSRLLYVAATRARDHLVVSLHHAAKAGRSPAARLMRARAHDLAASWTPPEDPTAARVPPLAGLAVTPAAPTATEHAREREALVRGARRLRVTSATGIAAEQTPGLEDGERGGDGDEPWTRGRGGTRVGRAVHAAIQTLPLHAGRGAVAAVATAQAVAEAVPERAAEVARLVRSAHASGAAERARAAGGGLREVPFAFTRDGLIVEGFIDLVIPVLGGLEIVDWKTDDVSAEQVGARVAGYATQAGLYAAGLTEATGQPVTRITYVFVRPRIEVSPGDPAALAQTALTALDHAPAE
jgi:ATP-dependent exoDNAse (exonuclease V) beta subunit